ncbi:helix-turn-helix domain-containing protein [Streptomyces albidoflavus]|nr:helix-turn-helix domain-containing protein [Streptomyces albidoflavus]
MDIVEGEVAAGVGAGARTVPEGEREPHPLDSLRTFGAFVQALCEHAGLSGSDLAAAVQYSKHTVESVELGRRMPDKAFVERAEEALGNTGALRRAARHLTRGEAGLAAWFRRRFGDAEAMRGLVDHVLELTVPRNVTLQVVPVGAALHACLDGPVQVLETLEGRRLGYSEGQQNGRLISDPKEMSLLCQRYETLRSQALNPKESRDLLERLRGEL